MKPLINIICIVFSFSVLIGFISCEKAETDIIESKNSAQVALHSRPNTERGLGEGESEEPYVQLSGRIVDENGEAVSNQEIELFSSTDSLLTESGTSSPQGNFEMQVNPGNYFFQMELSNGNTVNTDSFQLTEPLSIVTITIA